MADLFTCDLSTLSLQDVIDFLGLSLSESERLPENSRIDYKQGFPEDIGDDVAAMANVYGGLVFLGIRADKQKGKGNVPVEWKGVQLGPDVSARVCNRILSTVRPRPQFELGVVQTEGGAHIVVLRVQEGDYPPYEFEQGNSVKISLRINDVKRPAGVRDVEALLEKRSKVAASAADSLATLQTDSLFPYREEPSPGGGIRIIRDSTVHRIQVAPYRPVRLRLEVLFERKFEQWIREAFPCTRSFSRNYRTGTFYEVREIQTTPNELHRVWRISNSGAFGYVRNIDWHGSPGEPIGDVATDLLLFFRFGRKILEYMESFGRVFFADMLCIPSTRFLPKFPEPMGVHEYDDIVGVRFPDSRPEELPNKTEWKDDLDFHTLERPIELTTEILFDQLRASWGAAIHYDRLLEAVTTLEGQTRAPKWGRL